jgi:hypothetical protein
LSKVVTDGCFSGIKRERVAHRIPQVLLISFAILSTLSLAVLTVSTRANSDVDTLNPAAAIPTTDPAMLNGSAIRQGEAI